jgi:hypothetical protein
MISHSLNVALEFQMDPMMPFESQHLNKLPYTLRMQCLHPWPHLCLRFYKEDFLPMGIIQVDFQPWELQLIQWMVPHACIVDWATMGIGETC